MPRSLSMILRHSEIQVSCVLLFQDPTSMGLLATVRRVGNKTAEPEVFPFITVLRIRVLSPPYDRIYG